MICCCTNQCPRCGCCCRYVCHCRWAWTSYPWYPPKLPYYYPPPPPPPFRPVCPERPFLDTRSAVRQGRDALGAR